jgi:uracil-DNA glycosylase
MRGGAAGAVPQPGHFCYPERMGEDNAMATGSAAEALSALQESLRDCARCGLCAGRTQVVFGVGSPDARLLFVGEGPGFHEDRQGEPFVGAAGKLLTELLGQIGLTRADVYIANVVKCRPPDNRDPLPEEIAACSPHLMRQIAIIKPKVICTLGRFATKLLADTELSMTAIHGRAKQLEIAGVELVVFPVFHPAAALYTPSNRKMLEEDFAKLRHLLARGLSPRGEQAEAEGRATAPPAEAAAPPAEAGPPTDFVPRPAAPAGSSASTPPVAGRTDKGRGQGPASDRVEQLPLW